MIYEKSGDNEQALAEYESALEMDPENEVYQEARDKLIKSGE